LSSACRWLMGEVPRAYCRHAAPATATWGEGNRLAKATR
jgi:hypothetical protein